MEHDRDAVGFGGAIDDFEFFDAVNVVVRVEELVRRMNFDHADAEAEDVLDIGENVFGVAGMDGAAGDEAAGIGFDVVCDELIDGRAEAHDFRGNVVDEGGALDSATIEVFEEGAGGAGIGFDLGEVGTLRLHEREGGGGKHFVGLDVNVAVGDQGRSRFSVLRSQD